MRHAHVVADGAVWDHHRLLLQLAIILGASGLSWVAAEAIQKEEPRL